MRSRERKSRGHSRAGRWRVDGAGSRRFCHQKYWPWRSMRCIITAVMRGTRESVEMGEQVDGTHACRACGLRAHAPACSAFMQRNLWSALSDASCSMVIKRLVVVRRAGAACSTTG